MSASENLTLKQWVNFNTIYLRRSTTLADHPREFRQIVRQTLGCSAMFGGAPISTKTNVFCSTDSHLNYTSLQMSRPFKMSSYFAISYIDVFQVTFSVRRSLASLSKKRGTVTTTVQTNNKKKTVWFVNGQRLEGSNWNATLHRRALPVTQRYFQTYSSLFPDPLPHTTIYIYTLG